MFSTSFILVFSAFCIIMFVWRVKAAQKHMQGAIYGEFWIFAAIVLERYDNDVVCCLRIFSND